MCNESTNYERCHRQLDKVSFEMASLGAVAVPMTVLCFHRLSLWYSQDIRICRMKPRTLSDLNGILIIAVRRRRDRMKAAGRDIVHRGRPEIKDLDTKLKTVSNKTHYYSPTDDWHV